ncbi:MAG: NTP transferase domain-containing protein [Bacteroidales bacterium]|nr:NTP transferase domain-containing protein [Bacteroidales bacterium]
MDQNNYCVIMAGGVGSRFWPMSRTARPKQFLDILGTGQTLLEHTFNRFRKIIPAENILIVTNSIYGDLVREQLPELPEKNILLEPLRRNTAPCIAYASYKILERNPEASMVVAPSDHLILDEKKFLSVVKEGLQFVDEEKALMTIGILPSRPETGYGYIQVNGSSIAGKKYKNLKRVKTFTEKPDLKLAKVFLESGEFFWNSGIFFWSINNILDAFAKYLPEMHARFNAGKSKYDTFEEEEFIEQTYAKCKNISIDYGVMEKADNVHVITAEFGWSDLGTWGSLHGQLEKDKTDNTIIGEQVMTYDLKGCLVSVPADKLVVLQGLNDMIVVETDDVLLVCKMEDEQKIKNIVNDVRIIKGGDYV